MSASSVSVVVPTRNRAATLPRLLRSVLGQDARDLELVVVDDGSTDDTTAVLAACKDPRLRVVRHETARGVAHARNAGTAAATGRWVAWCDDDDVWSPSKLRLQLQALADAPQARWCNGGSAYVDTELRLSRVRRCPSPATVASDILRLNVITGGGSGVLADRRLALSVGGFDPRMSMYADWDMWGKLAQAAPLAVVDLPLVGYVEHAAGMSQAQLHLALDELALLQGSLDCLAAASGRSERLDLAALGYWVLRQQTSGGRRRDRLLLPFRLSRRGMLPPARVMPYSVLSGFAPGALQRRWARRWTRDPRYVEYAESWLTDLRRAEAVQE